MLSAQQRDLARHARRAAQPHRRACFSGRSARSHGPLGASRMPAVTLSHRRTDARAVDEHNSETEPLVVSRAVRPDALARAGAAPAYCGPELERLIAQGPASTSSRTSVSDAPLHSDVVDWTATGPCFLFPAVITAGAGSALPLPRARCCARRGRRRRRRRRGAEVAGAPRLAQ